MESKKWYRDQVRAINKVINDYERKEQSKIICEKLKSKLDMGKKVNIGVYVPTSSEVQINKFIEYAKENNAKLFYPVLTNKNKMVYVAENELPDDYFSNPFKEYALTETINKIDYYLVPGMAFDNNNYRLGYGRGCYDNYFSNHKNAYLIGLAYQYQLTQELPHTKNDIPMNEIIAA